MTVCICIAVDDCGMVATLKEMGKSTKIMLSIQFYSSEKEIQFYRKKMKRNLKSTTLFLFCTLTGAIESQCGVSDSSNGLQRAAVNTK